MVLVQKMNLEKASMSMEQEDGPCSDACPINQVRVRAHTHTHIKASPLWQAKLELKMLIEA